LTYEDLLRTPAPCAARLYRLLGVSDDPAIVAECVASTAFATTTGGRPRGVEKEGAFLRKGVVGDWRSAFTPAMSDIILESMAWCFPHFGWPDHRAAAVA
jgi:hypothetical protein